MRLTIIAATSLLVLAACQQQAAAPADEANVVANEVTVDATNAAAPMALASINETTWEFTDPKTGKAIQESVDAKGNYIANAGTEHFDHGTAVMKDGKACFTSAMNKDGEVCWTDPMLAEGQSGETTSDKGEKLTVKRVAYVPLTM
ncbi:MAG TPA: hypothetical protein VFK50_03030 [Sphingomicrobium sp.]|nr:hypothetical protein [Sphingomicrobium sp.]